MTQRTNRSTFPSRFPISSFRIALTTGLTAALLGVTLGAHAQEATPTPDAAAQTATPAAQTTAPDAQTATPAAAAPAAAQPKNDISLTNQKPVKGRKSKDEKVVASKATKKEVKKVKKDNQLAGLDVKLPDKQLYDKAEEAIKHGRFDVGRLDLQTLLNTYPESQFMMRAKLAIADSWYKEGGTAALTQAEQEYKDFITFFPNAPEAAEAQMRVGDIYFRQMDKPDRDYTTTVHAEQEYRLMLQQFPESTLVPQANQRLREVQETLASRETNIASFYGTRTPPNYPAAIARYQTVVDSYPLYSHMDDVLIGLGDAYAAEAKFVRSLKLPEAGKARLEKIYDDEAQAAYNKVVLEHAAALHVEDAKDRLVGMGLPVPTPTPDQLAASTSLENSRGQYTLSKRAIGFIMHQADTVPAATIGAPPLEDTKPTSAAAVVRKSIDDFKTSMNPAANMAPVAASSGAGTSPATADGSSVPAAAPLTLQEVPASTTAGGSSPAVINMSPSSPSSGGTSMGIEIVRPDSNLQPITAPATPPAFPGTTPAAPAAKPPVDTTGGIGPLLPANATPLPPIEKAATAPDPINDAASRKQPPAQAAVAGKKKPKPTFDKADESSSKHKKKKGIAKINPF